MFIQLQQLHIQSFYNCSGHCFLFFTNFPMLSYQIPDFVSAKADFGTDLAISTRTELDPGDTVSTLCST